MPTFPTRYVPYSIVLLVPFEKDNKKVDCDKTPLKVRLYKFEICYALVTSLLSIVLTKTSINGILGRGGMHLFSLNQLQQFLEVSTEWISHDKRLLDLGAGDGQITAVMARLYKTVSVTEASKIGALR
ncbi:unnamed protein product [Onchocerca flexuosa]|uniref:Methyltransferase-like protein 9 n=1 Tax=Onchocerca flexuosa TaxID=387005 RepID=A0A183H3L5_9BILA|nr:unnamed protein product [Onchocerca flexuosa]